MKKQFLLMAIIAMLVGTFSSCNRNGNVGNDPILYVVNGSDYSANVYCDNHLVATAGAHNNSGKVELSNVSINMPVYVEVIFYNNKGNKVNGYTWNSYYFRWDRTYKMTLTNSSSTSSLTEI
ncbi:MAG: hypothetical protein IKG86_05210 [Paludibacteraceae bacterium]|nr:hypothetical protein [Paludibacteraceae bacterium]